MRLLRFILALLGGMLLLGTAGLMFARRADAPPWALTAPRGEDTVFLAHVVEPYALRLAAFEGETRVLDYDFQQRSLWVYDSNAQLVRWSGGTAHPLSPQRVRFVDWSADGEWLIYSQTDRNLYRVHRFGGQPQTIAHVDAGYWVQGITPDGRWILISEEDTKTFYRLPMEGGEMQPFMRLELHEYFRQWSPDGRWLTSMSSQDVRTAVVRLANVDTGETELMRGLPLNTARVLWSPDSSWLYLQPYMRTINEPPRLTRMSVQDGQLETLPLQYLERGAVRPLGWKPDGEHLLIAYADGEVFHLLQADRQAKDISRLSLPEVRSVLQLYSWSPNGEWAMLNATTREASNVLYALHNSGSRGHIITGQFGETYQRFWGWVDDPRLPWQPLWMAALGVVLVSVMSLGGPNLHRMAAKHSP